MLSTVPRIYEQSMNISDNYKNYSNYKQLMVLRCQFTRYQVHLGNFGSSSRISQKFRGGKSAWKVRYGTYAEATRRIADTFKDFMWGSFQAERDA